MTNYCMKCDHQDHESNLIPQGIGLYLCENCFRIKKLKELNELKGFKKYSPDPVNIFGMFCVGYFVLFLSMKGNWEFAGWNLCIFLFLIYMEFYRRSKSNNE